MIVIFLEYSPIISIVSIHKRIVLSSRRESELENNRKSRVKCGKIVENSGKVSTTAPSCFGIRIIEIPQFPNRRKISHIIKTKSENLSRYHWVVKLLTFEKQSIKHIVFEVKEKKSRRRSKKHLKSGTI